MDYDGEAVRSYGTKMGLFGNQHRARNCLRRNSGLPASSSATSHRRN